MRREDYEIHIILDNLSTHKAQQVKEWTLAQELALSFHADLQLVDQSSRDLFFDHFRAVYM